MPRKLSPVASVIEDGKDNEETLKDNMTLHIQVLPEKYSCNIKSPMLKMKDDQKLLGSQLQPKRGRIISNQADVVFVVHHI